MSEIPEIEALELTVVQADTLTGERWTGEMVRWSDAEAAVRSALDRQARDFAAAGVSVVEANDPDHEPCAGTGSLVRAWPPGDVGDPCHCVRWELRLDPASALARDLLVRQAREIVEDARAEAAGDVSPPIAYALRWFASRVEQRFAPKEADPR